MNIPELYPVSISGKVQVYYSAAENDYVQAQVVYYSSPSRKGHRYFQAAVPH